MAVADAGAFEVLYIRNARARVILVSTLPSGSVSLLFCSRQGFTGLTGLLPLLRVLESRSRHCTLQASKTPHSESKQESPARPHAAFHKRQCRFGGKAPRPLTAHSCHLRRAYPAPRALAGLAGRSRPPGPAKQSTPYFDVKVPPTLTSNYPLL